MADSTLSTMDAVAALMDERKKYDGWITALDGRRGATPPRVYERVRADYQGRLDQVLAEISGRASELESVAVALRTRVEALEKEEESRQDERAEAELRAAVGEYSVEQWEELRGVADSEIGHVSAQLAEQRAELERVEGILAIARGPRASEAPSAGGAGPDAGGVRPSAPARDELSIGVVRVAADPPTERDRTAPPAVGADLSRPVGGAWRESPPAGTRSVGEPARADEPARRADGFDDRAESDSAFDDLAFLKSIVEPTAPSASAPATPPSGAGSTRPIPRGEESRLSTPGRGLAALRSLLGTDDRAAGARPTGGDEPLRASGSGQRDDAAPATGAKTLRCGECGTLNYPTEWYCERCGGELATM